MIACQRDEWLSAVTGHSCHSVSGEGDSASVSAALAEAGDGFFFTKRPVNAVASIKYFTDSGFFLVDTNVTLEMPAVSPVGTVSSGIDVLPARPADHDAVQKIADTSFIYSRFHLDPLFADELANRVKREWIRSYCEGRRGDKLFVVEREGRVVGFLAALTIGVGRIRAAVIDLVAVDATARAAGMGAALVAGFQTHYHGQVDVLRVGTQIANVASLGLYRRCGFSIKESAYVLHAHYKDGVCL